MDSIDLAQDINSQFLAESLNKVMSSVSGNGIVAQELDKKGRVICSNCGILIPKKRLKAIPNAIYCVECQEEIENQNRL